MARVVRLMLQQFGHAEDACQRRAHVMAHVGQKGAFGAVGRFSQLFFAVDLECRAADAHDSDNAYKRKGKCRRMVAF